MRLSVLLMVFGQNGDKRTSNNCIRTNKFMLNYLALVLLHFRYIVRTNALQVYWYPKGHSGNSYASVGDGGIGMLARAGRNGNGIRHFSV